MKIVHIESGLGNQMLSYCEYIAIKKMNPQEDIYIENIIYDIPECNDIICQWNGYELERIFRIKAANIKDQFSQEKWDNIMNEIHQSEFWNKNWNWPVYFSKAFINAGLNIKNIRGDFETKTFNIEKGLINHIRKIIRNTYIGTHIKRLNNKLRSSSYIKENDHKKELFLQTTDNILTGQWLSFKFKGNNRHLIDDEIKNTFIFPDFTDEKNINMKNFLETVNGVAIHARRGDMLDGLGAYYKYGYFKRAVKHIRKHVENPVFVFFTNPGSITWCKENAKVFGLDYKKDKVYFVDWNTGESSYRDMQLMGYCKHAIITSSTFGWWGAYFIKNPNKITISPLVEIDTTMHC